MSRYDLAALLDAYTTSSLPMVLATVIQTAGSTYRKPGARMLIDQNDKVTGILGGGCFDSDLIEHARTVFQDSRTRCLTYDMRSTDEALWGLGLGCKGEVRIFMQLVDGSAHDPLRRLRSAKVTRVGASLVTITASEHPSLSAGQNWLWDDARAAIDSPLPEQSGLHRLTDHGHSLELFVDHIPTPYHLLICGAGVDAYPLVETASSLGWRVSVLDHRAAFAKPEHFPRADTVLPFTDGLPPTVRDCDAAVIMSHHLHSDRNYLRALIATDAVYIGVLGPAERRATLLQSMEKDAATLAPRLHGPVGLDLGGELPEEVALSIVAEIQAQRYRRNAHSLSA